MIKTLFEGATLFDEIGVFAITYNVPKAHTVTLLYHCAEDEPHCHRHLLKVLLEKKI